MNTEEQKYILDDIERLKIRRLTASKSVQKDIDKEMKRRANLLYEISDVSWDLRLNNSFGGHSRSPSFWIYRKD